MSTILILAMALSVTAPPGSRMSALENLPPSPVWLESLYGPPETIPTGMPTDCHAVLHANDWVLGAIYLSVRLDGAAIYSDSERFELSPGESLPVWSGWWLYDSGYYEVKDSAVCESYPDSAYQVVWDFLIGPRHHGGIGISRIVQVPGYLVDTFWTQTPEFELANYGLAADSGWAFVLFSDIGQDRVVHADSVWFSLEQGEHQDVVFQSFRFHTLGPHVGVCGWTTIGGDADSLSWCFDVAYLQPPSIAIVAFLVMPWDTIDTFRTWQPCVRVKNTGALSDSVWVALKFSDTLADRTVYADSHHLLLHGGESDDVSFQSIRFSVPGPYHGQLALRGLRGESETADWDFWVDGNLGVEERSVCADADVTPTIVRSVLFLPVSLFTPHSSLFDMTGRAVMSLRPGENDVSCLSPGVYFVREGQAKTVRKVVLTK